jgi:hypothetical protein
MKDLRDEYVDILGQEPLAPEPIAPPPNLLKLSDLKLPEKGGPEELLADRFLCRGKILLLVGSAGIGKSTFAMQAIIHWALGKPFLGIRPSRPLRSLIIQAENDTGDLGEMRHGVFSHLELSAEEHDLAEQNVRFACEYRRTSLQFIDEVVRPLCDEVRPDLLWVDPFLAYLGGDTNSQVDVGAFLRSMLEPLLEEYQCGGVVIHHTNKPKGEADKNGTKGGDFAYAGSGSAEYANIPRAVLSIQSVGSHQFYKFRAGKRGGRLGWRGELEERVNWKWIRQSDRGMHWEESTDAEARAAMAEESPRASHRAVTLDDVALCLVGGPMEKKHLEAELNRREFSKKRASDGVKALIESGELHAGELPRRGVRASIWVSIGEISPANWASIKQKEKRRSK